MRRFPVIIGPTAGGKSAMAVKAALALRLHGVHAEIVTADSIQVYRGLDIGSAKPTHEEREGVPHHLIDLVEPTEPFSVNRWLELAEPLIADIRARSALPIVVGGTHLYVTALLYGLFEGPEADPDLRERLSARDPAELRRELESRDPQAAARIHPNDLRRTVRALEVFELTGRPISEWQTQWGSGGRSDALVVGLEWPVGELNRRINSRVKAMMNAGLVEEVRALRDAARLGPQSREALGYKQILEHLEGARSREEAFEQVKIQTRRFAKNQRTWLRRFRTYPESLWLEMDGTTFDRSVQTLVSTVLAHQ